MIKKINNFVNYCLDLLGNMTVFYLLSITVVIELVCVFYAELHMHSFD